MADNKETTKRTKAKGKKTLYMTISESQKKGKNQ
jgi:hypothetical protein